MNLNSFFSKSWYKLRNLLFPVTDVVSQIMGSIGKNIFEGLEEICMIRQKGDMVFAFKQFKL